MVELRRRWVCRTVELFLDIEGLYDLSVAEVQDLAMWGGVTWHTMRLRRMCHGALPVLCRQGPWRDLTKSKPPEIVFIFPHDII